METHTTANHLEDFVGEDSLVRAVDAFVDLVDIDFSNATAIGKPVGSCRPVEIAILSRKASAD
ncbi:hypothetical protein [Falsihalocynthiibacter arcticus]|uniref:Uncharacterized protein n=1 Tax=Falsihalocynthiibacter arcticus TaxID=1579316 RepID=A0A126V0D6_9RHOB|nr:hypothetical protein [Falsihalocynthiibacter arcticus]AML51159.1 hypothetical protein RC74_07710 [Falsihalocynthiibacter arcticus]